MRNKTIYLTFDDGIQEGTSNVLKILEKHKVRSTFFLTGINTFYAYQRDFKRTCSALEILFKNHLICNHSFSHCYDFYSSYYTKGLLISATERISALQDFCNNEIFLKNILSESNLKNSSLNTTLPNIARLPGRNSWCLSIDKIIEGKKVVEDIIYYKVDTDSKEALNDLFRSGYQVFGWDEEWKMSFDFAMETKATRNYLMKNNLINYSNFNHLYPDYDMNNENNATKDRLIESWDEVAERIISSKKNKIILLMHDRAFRNFESNESSIKQKFDELDNFIYYLKSQAFKFETLDNYSLEH